MATSERGGAIEGTVAATVHGHYWLRPAAGGAATPASLLVGFHGYGESATDHLEALSRIPGIQGWHLAAVQGLHSFYKRSGEVVAGWMTSLDRELAIADNLAYVAAAVAALRAEVNATGDPVFAGFSQGVAMAYRAAAAQPAAGLIALAGDIPPEVDPKNLPPVLLGRGRGDTWYDDTKLQADIDRLKAAGIPHTQCVFDGGHEWTEVFHQAAATFLASLPAG